MNAPEHGIVDNRYVPSPVPLPPAAWLLLCGLGAIAGIGRLRRRAP